MMLFASIDLVVFVFQVAEGVASEGVEDLVVDEGVVGVTEVDGVRTFIYLGPVVMSILSLVENL